MITAHGRNLNRFLLRGIKDTALITWSETLGEAGMKRRAAYSAGKKIAQRQAGKQVAKKVTKRAVAKRVATRGIPIIGWGIAIYDVFDYLIGDDPSLIGDIERLIAG